MTRRTATYFIACVGLGVWTGMASEPWDFPADFQFGAARDGHLSDVLERIRRGNNLPALAAVSMTSTGTIELAATGLRAVGFRDRVTDNDQWHLGSITKPMTATVAARLVEKGFITWDTTIGQAVPALAGAMRKEYRKVTLAQLLRHESGLPRDVPMESQSSETAQRLLPKDMPDWIPPGLRYEAFAHREPAQGSRCGPGSATGWSQGQERVFQCRGHDCRVDVGESCREEFRKAL